MQGATVRGIDLRARHLISIHAPCAGGDNTNKRKFDLIRNFNPRPLCRGRRVVLNLIIMYILFQSTPPVQGATLRAAKNPYTVRIFQSTPPVQGATVRGIDLRARHLISIHAPCAGGDLLMIKRL